MLSNIFSTTYNNSKQSVLGPLLTLIKICLLYFKLEGTKISFINNRIYYQYPHFLQGTLRWKNGDKRDDLSYLINPISKAILWYNNTDNNDIKNIFFYSVKGLKCLKNTYSNRFEESNLICHSISHYINIISNSINLNTNTNINSDINTNINTNINPSNINSSNININDNLLINQKNKNKKSNNIIINNNTNNNIIDNNNNNTNNNIIDNNNIDSIIDNNKSLPITLPITMPITIPNSIINNNDNLDDNTEDIINKLKNIWEYCSKSFIYILI